MTSPTTTPPTNSATAAPATGVEHLIRQLYGLGAVRRELGKAAHRELASQGFTALVAIHRGGACRVSDIAAALQVDLSVASRQIAALVEAGHLDRQPDPADGRAHLLHLTDAGIAAIARAHGEMLAVLGDALADWSPADIETLALGLGRLTASFTTLPAAAEQEIAR